MAAEEKRRRKKRVLDFLARGDGKGGKGALFFSLFRMWGGYIRVTPPPPPLRSPPSLLPSPVSPQTPNEQHIPVYGKQGGKGGKTVFLVRESDGIVK